MNSLKDEDFKQIKEICNDDFEQNDKEIVNYISLKINLIIVFVKISQFKYMLYYYQKIKI
jgi:hypothetical protein